LDLNKFELFEATRSIIFQWIQMSGRNLVWNVWPKLPGHPQNIRWCPNWSEVQLSTIHKNNSDLITFFRRISRKFLRKT